MTNSQTIIHYMYKVSKGLGLSVKDIIKKYPNGSDLHKKVCVFHYRLSQESILFNVDAQAEILGVDNDLIYYRVDKGRRLVNYHKRDYEWIK